MACPTQRFPDPMSALLGRSVSAWTAAAIDVRGCAVHTADTLPLGCLIEEAVELNVSLGNRRFPLARHHARILWVQAARAHKREIQADALALLNVLDQAIRPDATLWRPLLAALNASIGRALDDTGQPESLTHDS